MVVQFREPAAPEKLQLLQERGASILEYVPQFGYVVAAPDSIFLDDLNLQWNGSLTAREKLSPALKENPASRTSFAVVEFYSDVAMSEARAIVLAANLHVFNNSYLLPHDLLVAGPPRGLLALGGWDEVEYIFPASDDLVLGRSVNACPGALTDQGQVGQSVPKVGSWGPPGGSASLQYAFVDLTKKLAIDAAESEIVRAFSTWSKYVQVNWSETSDTTAQRTVAILFGLRAHGDAWPFDGPGGVVAHTFYPYPVNSEPIAGDMHFDGDENWQIGADTDLFSVALHEAGHALGLGHSDQPGAVMYPYYRRVTDLSPEDIAAIQTLYASRDGSGSPAPPSNPSPLTLTVADPGTATTSSTLNLSGSTAGGVAPIAVSWVTDAQVSGTATGFVNWTIQGIPLHSGDNNVTITAVDSQKVSVARTVAITHLSSPPVLSAPTLQITSPVASGTYNTTSSLVVLAGTASDSNGISQVSWTTSSGASGIAMGTISWNSSPIQLTAATTQISVTALSTDGGSTTQSIQIAYTPPPNPTNPSGGSVAGNAPPALTILSPAVTALTVSTATLAVSGAASSNAGIASVEWATLNGDSGTAIGSTSWNIPAIPLLIGTNTVTINAYDGTGASSWRSLVVTRSSSN